MSGTVPFFIDPEIGNSLWDNLFLGGTDWPGVWRIEVTKSRTVTKVKVKGKDGVTTTDEGYDGATLRAVGVIWLQEQFDDLQALLPNFDPRQPGVTRTPLDIYTPATALLGVDSVYLEKVNVTPPEGGKLTITLDLSEWFPSTKTTKTTTKVKGFDGTSKAGAPLNASDFKVTPPSQGPANL
jgi:hypothetical protein